MLPSPWPGLVVLAIDIYAAAGALIAAAFLLVGLDRVMPAARGAYGFRPLLVPGLILLWPVVAARWAALERAR